MVGGVLQSIMTLRIRQRQIANIERQSRSPLDDVSVARRRSRVLATQAAIVCCIACPSIIGPANARDVCQLTPGSRHIAVRVIDGETLGLDDGREVRLIGALAPRASDARATAGAWPPEMSAIRYLSSIVVGQSVQLGFGDGARTDRYGRLQAHVFVGDGPSRRWVQGEMLAAGWARAYALGPKPVCASELLDHEDSARPKGVGLWSLPTYQALSSDETGQLMQRRHSFTLVTGKVDGIARTASGTYLNFGSDWKSDFTIAVSKEVLKREPDFAAKLDGFKGRNVRVRGWIERRNGPMIELTHSSQLEFDDAATGDASTRPAFPHPPAAHDDDVDSAKQNRPAPSSETIPGDFQL